MSLSGHFSSKHVHLNKQTGKEVKTFEDFPTTVLRHSDGSHAVYQGGKMKPGTHVKESKNVAKVDVPTPESKFYKETLISTILETKREGEKDTVGEKEAVASVRKPFDVNRKSLKL